MKSLKTAPELVLFPLLVMLLLTVLVGITAYEVTNTWQQSAEKTTRKTVQAVMLTNIRWGLYRVQNELKTNPGNLNAAKGQWGEIRQQVNLLAEAAPSEATVQLLRTFMSKPENIRKIETILDNEFFNTKLTETHAELKTLQQHSHFITTAVTLCMLTLGGVLIGITAWDLTRLVKELLRSRDLNIRLQEEERQRIAQELHDGVLQELIDLKRGYQTEKVDNLIESLRRVCHNLKPQVLDDLGLAAALEFLADDLRQSGLTQVQVNLDADGLEKLPKTYELPLFRVVQELCSNIKRHAQATQATLTIVYQPDESPLLRGYISDNGRGFDPKAEALGQLGLTGVQERIQQTGGSFEMNSAPGEGSRFRFSIPVRPPAKRKHA